MPLIDLGLTLVAMGGHAAIWTYVLDQLHASGVEHPTSRRWTRCLLLVLTLGELAILASVVYRPFHASQLAGPRLSDTLRGAYFALCWAAAAWRFVPGLARRWLGQESAVLASNHTHVVDLRDRVPEPLVQGRATRLMARLPGNQIFRLSVHEKTLLLPGLDPALDGLSITHLSDLHFYGHIRRPVFEEIVRQANELRGDLIAVTGDLVDRPECLDWIPHTLGRLRAEHGVYYVLGNHDARVDVAALHAMLDHSGLIWVGGQARTIEVCGRQVRLAGNELPWFGPPPTADTPAHAAAALRILLSHAPDQIEFARAHRFELMLAGHTHGGQIRLPLIGPVFTCSRFGTRFIAGVYHVRPTILHTSRGLGAVDPLRFRCPPELTKLVLRRSEPAEHAAPGRTFA